VRRPRRGSRESATALVRRGWNRVSYVYRAEGGDRDAFGHTFDERREWLRPVLEELPPGARILDLGCGCGVPDDALLSERFRVTGVDLSDVQIERARRLVPHATFRRADMTSVAFPHRSFDAVLAFHSIIHVPLPRQPPLFRRILRWLVPGGVFVAILGASRWEGTEAGWLGSNAAMYWSHADARTYARWLEEAGFDVVSHRFVPEGDGGHELFWTRKPGSPDATGARASRRKFRRRSTARDRRSGPPRSSGRAAGARGRAS
jgi:SAM-dependent methyltransferase